MEFDARHPLPEIAFATSSSFPVSGTRTAVFFFAGKSREDLSGVDASFDIDNGLADIAPGTWLFPDGHRADTACNDD